MPGIRPNHFGGEDGFGLVAVGGICRRRVCRGAVDRTHAHGGRTAGTIAEAPRSERPTLVAPPVRSGPARAQEARQPRAVGRSVSCSSAMGADRDCRWLRPDLSADSVWRVGFGTARISQKGYQLHSARRR